MGDGAAATDSFPDVGAMKVVVVGVLAMDISARLPDEPRSGDGVGRLTSLAFRPGGKGYNQAVAAAKLGAQVAILGAVGGVPGYDVQIAQALRENGVDVSRLHRVPGAASPLAVLLEHPDGGESIIGAGNEKLVSIDPAYIERNGDLIRDADVVLATCGIPAESIEAAFALARESRGMTVLNPAPLPNPPEDLPKLPFHLTDLVVPNEWEARRLTGLADSRVLGVEDLAKGLRGRGAREVCVTLGEAGCFYQDETGGQQYPAYRADSVVSVAGASDSFVPTLALALRLGCSRKEAVSWAQAAASFTIARKGVSGAMPTRRSLEAFHRSLGPASPRRAPGSESRRRP